MHHEEKRDPVLQVQGVWTQVLRLPKPEDQEATSYTGALSSFPSDHPLQLWQSRTQSIHMPSEKEEQEAL